MFSKSLLLILFVVSSSLLIVYCEEEIVRKGEGAHYSPDDGIEMLDAESFRPTVYNSSVAWFVKFYTRWCGHCKLFAPTYKKMAKDIEEWRNVVRLAAVDCASKSENGEDTGRRVCFTKPFFITGMPDFRFFPANSTDEDFAGHRRKYEGTKVYGRDGKVKEDSDSLEKVRESLIGFIQGTLPNSANPTLSLETMKKKDIEVLINGEPNWIHRVIIIEPKSSFLGRQVILDMSAFRGIQVRRVAQTNKKALGLLDETYGFKFESSPTVLIIKDKSSYASFAVPDNEDINQREYIRTKLQSLPDVRRIQEMKYIVKRNATEQEDDDQTLPDVDRTKIYMHDLEVAIHYSLRKEVSGVEYIQGRHLQGLKDYVATLVKYFPGRPPVMKFLMRINKTIKDLLVTKMLVWGTWQELLEKADEASGAYLTSNETYYGCSGSLSDHRGYPCSLWQLFHVLVNQAYTLEPDGEWAIGVLINMQEYITRYFTCMECRKHWHAATEDIYKVGNSSEAILYLWSKHNAVNLRLSGGKKEDPLFPKIQWPTREMCPGCWNENMEFDRAEVLKFLLDFYSPNNFSYDYVEELKTSRPGDEL